ncbi:hypothetical protein [Polaromonas jejuensis]|uniref:DUF883 domain-containing protein n=1 Tax=Polaromonas jejuensis TaxID=457502 RepID=A0ABW0QBC9_9BURK|nr:hypothetical protein [Polaromonas jejuensis]
MNTNTPAQAAREASNELLQTTGNAVDKAGNQVHELRGRVDPVVDMLTSKAQQLARHSLDLAAEAKDRAQQSLNRAAGVTTRYVSEQPVRSVLIAAAVGAAVALLVASSRQRNKNRY